MNRRALAAAVIALTLTAGCGEAESGAPEFPPPTTAPRTTVVPPADLGPLLVDLGPQGFTPLQVDPGSAFAGALPDAAAAARLDEERAERTQERLEAAGFTRGHAGLVQDATGQTIIARAIFEFATVDGAESYYDLIEADAEGDPSVAIVDLGGLPEAFAYSYSTSDDLTELGGGLEGYAWRAGRVYIVIIAGLEAAPDPALLVDALTRQVAAP